VAKTSTSGFEFANANKKKYGYKLEVVEESSIMYQKVKNGDAVALFEDTPVIKYNIASKQVNFELPTGTEGKFNYGFAVYKGSNKELLKKFNAGLKALKENGEYDKILKKYLG
jgi:polar amino acid transport system substrate-binding protein